MHQKKMSIVIVLIALLFVTSLTLSRKKPEEKSAGEKKPLTVSVQSTKESKEVTIKSTFPALLISDGEVKVTARSAGTITTAPGNIGSPVSVGMLLASIDDAGTLSEGEYGLKSLQIKQSNITVSQAKKTYTLAKESYDKIRKSDSATSIEKESAKTQRDIAKLQYESALLGQTNTLDSHRMISPISGFIINSAVSVGDSVAIGQPIATIGRSTLMKAQFFVNQEERSILSRGQEISAMLADGTSVPFLIRNIALAADPTTKRFLIEALPKKQDAKLFLSGTIITMTLETTVTPKESKNILLPLSTLTISQNENSLFIVEDNKAKKIPVTIVSVRGENAEIFAEIKEESLIITEGNKLINDGETIVIRTK
ncbi:MAG: hypothetical protein COZ86_01970 [Candidatus Moranbacteria bacterium CG_4_8_14_3_um_filter_41_13]|nr:MAG: hypothetical protein AUK58_01350 [Candidatus Moranbacteria bacterium CG2_30_41_165]PIW94267.1 MAG: hypothetical protein COZ86_01970 [Candidatus Moranbacteria bacterium CG_4_8_14_3_um_filter_41_13]PJC00357.1 MAG: hypothetical protein CO075_01040 [Candidatus Moranbacteria bacterium CG_4_9_14_0_8_um_filter_41_43]